MGFYILYILGAQVGGGGAKIKKLFCNAMCDWITSKICDSISCDILSEIV